MKNFKKLCIVLVLTISFMSFNNFSYAVEDEKNVGEDISNLEIRENTNESIEFSYQKIENGKKIKYEEVLTDNHIQTKKYEGDTLIDKFESFIDVNNGEVSVRIEKDNSSQVITVGEIIQNDMDQTFSPFAVVPGNKTRHPLNNEYYRVIKTGGHLGFQRLTEAAIVGSLGAIVSGGSLAIGSLASMAKLLISGGYRNVYYTEELYYPYGNDMKGEPLSKTVIKIYSGNDKTNQIGKTLYYDSDLVVEV